MKRQIIIISAMFFVLSAGAQQVKQEVISSAGGFNKSSDNSISISWTLGETVIPAYTSPDGSLVLAHAFQQKLIITTEKEALLNEIYVTVYPNPASAILNIRFEVLPDAEISVFILDALGKVVKTEIIDASVKNKQIDMANFQPGIYYLRLKKGSFVNVYKVVKL